MLSFVGNNFDIAPVVLVVLLASEENDPVLRIGQGNGGVVNEII